MPTIEKASYESEAVALIKGFELPGVSLTVGSQRAVGGQQVDSRKIMARGNIDSEGVQIPSFLLAINSDLARGHILSVVPVDGSNLDMESRAEFRFQRLATSDEALDPELETPSFLRFEPGEDYQAVVARHAALVVPAAVEATPLKVDQGVAQLAISTIEPIHPI